ncbi:uncharacterized protein G2W53_023360 [Senna tora]|uniref:SANT domain-containing protein n=1 Tax=Senna tora TaxID=362788 RepID=A0A834T9Y4_9FABA|nr:uncharacterized protein G2W53_023360 [Senna tora]
MLSLRSRLDGFAREFIGFHMELAHLDHNNNCLVYASDMKSTPPSSPDISDIVGAPQMTPRLGDEYQVETPPMITESERLKLLLSPADSELVNDNSYSFAMGLPVPLIWVHNEVEESKSSLQGQSKAYGMPPSRLSNSWSDADEKSFLLGLFIFGKNFIHIKRFLDDKGMGEIMSFYYGKFYKSNEYRRWSDYRKIKGRKCMTGQKLFTGWRQHELVSRLNSKVTEKLQDTLLQLLSVMSLDPHFAHVYKQISKSYAKGRASLEEYIFSLKSTVGLGVLVEAVGIGKEKEDLTRLAVESVKHSQSFSVYPCVPTSKAWSSLEPNDIIKFLTGGFRLSKAKSNDLFWEAVWPRLLARGWHSEQPNNNPGFVSSRDYLIFLIPGVKKFSRRKLVKGNHYFDSISDVLSKVVSEPNLLELEVEEAKVGGCTEEDGLFPENASSDKDDQFDSHRPCYLKPRVPTFNTDDMKFTVVDTSLVYRGKSSDLRELKYLPLGFNITSKKINQMTSGNTVSKTEVCNAGKTHKGDKHLGEANHKKGVSDNNSNKLSKCTVVDTSLVHRGKLSSKVRELRCVPVELKDTSKKMAALSREIEGISSPGEKEDTVQLENREKNSNADCHRSTMDVDATINKRRTYDNINNKADKIVERQRNPKTCKSDDKLLKKIMKQQSGPTARSGKSNNAASPIKRRRLTACVKAETRRILEISSGDLGSEKSAFSRSSSFPEANKKSGNQVSHKQNVCFVASPAKEIVEDDKKGILLIKNCPGRAMSCSKVEKCESQQPINSNIIEVPPKSENDEMMEEDDKCQNPNAGELVPNPVVTSSGDGSMEQNPDMNQRRHSTRNRPLTVKALESIESDFMIFVQRQPKKKEDQAPKDPFNPCRRARTRVKATTHRHSSGGGSAVSMEDRHLNGDNILNTCLGLYLILFDSVNPVCNVLAQKKKLSDKLGSQWTCTYSLAQLGVAVPSTAYHISNEWIFWFSLQAFLKNTVSTIKVEFISLMTLFAFPFACMELLNMEQLLPEKHSRPKPLSIEEEQCIRVFYENKLQEVCNNFHFPHKIQSLEFDLIVYAPYRSVEGFVNNMEDFRKAGDELLQMLKALQDTARLEVDKMMLTDAPLLFPPGQLALAALRNSNVLHKVLDFESYLNSIISHQNHMHTVSELIGSLNAIDSWVKKYKFPSEKELKHINRKLKSCWGLSSHDEYFLYPYTPFLFFSFFFLSSAKFPFGLMCYTDAGGFAGFTSRSRSGKSEAAGAFGMLCLVRRSLVPLLGAFMNYLLYIMSTSELSEGLSIH